MEAKTALELWNDGAEGRLNLQLYRCDVDSLLQGGLAISPLRLFGFDSPSYEEFFDDILREDWVTRPFRDLDSSGGEEAFEAIILEGQVTPPLRLFDHLDSPTYEELFEQNWQLFEEESDQELESSRSHKHVPEDLDLLDTPKVMRPEPTCLTRVIQGMVLYPPSIGKAPKKRKKKNWGRHKRSRPPRKTSTMVSEDENDDEVESEVGDPPDEVVGCKESCQPEKPITESSSSVYHRAQMQDTPWESPSGAPTSPQVLPVRPIATLEVVPSFAEHLARCAVDWDYPRVLFSMGGYGTEPVFQKMAPPQTGETLARPGSGSSPTVPSQPLTPAFVLKHKSPTLGASNGLRKKRYADSNPSSDSERPHGPGTVSASRDVENVEPITKPAPRQNKRRRLVT